MMLFDSHCHLPHHKYTKSTEQVIQDAWAAGVANMIAIGTSIEENEQAIKVADAYAGLPAQAGVYCSIGIHIDENMNKPLKDLERILSGQLKLSKKIVAIGECGIDVSEWENGRPACAGRQIQDQINLFEMQIELAIKHHLPVIIHNCNGDNEVLALVKKYTSQELRGVAHCFSQSWDFAQQLLQCGLYLSFSGMITYKGRKGILKTVQNAPIDKILIETDAPYLSPEGFRGQVNEPKNVFAVAQKIGDAGGISFNEVAQKTYENAQTLFCID